MIGAVLIVTALIAERATFHARFTDVTSRLQRVTALTSEMVRLDDRLTLSAEMAVASGEGTWIDRYEADVPRMDDVIAQARSLAPPETAQRFDEETRVANDALVKLEREALDHLRDGRVAQAKAVLRGLDYLAHKQTLANGSTNLATALRRAAEHDVASLLLQAAAFVGGLLLVGFGGL